MRRHSHDELVLAVYPTARGVAYALFSAPLTPLDWEHRRIRVADKNVRSLETVKRLCSSLQPDVLVMEDVLHPSCRRSARVRRLCALIASFAEAEGLTLVLYSRATVRSTFRAAGAITRYEIAQIIGSMIPAFSHRLPRAKKPWQSEDHRVAIFEAAALALTHYATVPEDDKPP